MARASSEVLGQGQVAFDVLAVPSSLRLLRLGVADRAAGMGLDSEAVERARNAVDELAAVLVGAEPGARLHVVVSDDGRRLLLEGEVEHDGPVPELDQIVQELLDLCLGAAGWRIRSGEGRLSFAAVVRAR